MPHDGPGLRATGRCGSWAGPFPLWTSVPLAAEGGQNIGVGGDSRGLRGANMEGWFLMTYFSYPESPKQSTEDSGYLVKAGYLIQSFSTGIVRSIKPTLQT